jgi:hypothetical protein
MKTKKKLIRTLSKSKRKRITNNNSNNNKNNKNKNKNKRGGLLIMNPETDLINTHICNVKAGSEKDSLGLEILTSISKAFQLNKYTLGYLQQMYKSADDKWFKFVIFNNSGTNYIYIIDGAKINKHSVSMIQGLLDVTKASGEYSDLREIFTSLQLFKNNYGSNMESLDNAIKNELLTLITRLDSLVERDIKCMPIIAAGSGSINADNSICINNKSGHYKPTNESMILAKTIFEVNTEGAVIFIKEKEDKAVLKQRYGENYENYTGICI